ncbi:hypothetical protein SO802_027821 [Lithocarpus litseifolius]|uniref:F-box associated domain-containing protein n=1 Tax=Lithocarpus litseifolius TaxID=425828 RepID=A0AAW2BP97_9ROSI
MEEEASAMSGLRRPNNGFQIVFGELNKSNFFEAIGSHLYCVGTASDYDPNSVNNMRTLMCTIDITNPSDGWKFGSMTVYRDMFHTHTVVLDVLESKKQILVTSPIRHGYHDSCLKATFYTYNVTTRCWATLESPMRKLRGRTCRLSNRVVEAVGNTLYWVFFKDNYLVVRAYDLDKDVWFEGSMNICEEFFGKHEYLSYGELDRVPFLHLYDQKFCLLVP